MSFPKERIDNNILDLFVTGDNKLPRHRDLGDSNSLLHASHAALHEAIPERFKNSFDPKGKEHSRCFLFSREPRQCDRNGYGAGWSAWSKPSQEQYPGSYPQQGLNLKQPLRSAYPEPTSDPSQISPASPGPSSTWDEYAHWRFVP
ncbi:hypothetical protein K449DRAFT_389290 [Hypoxylon sp. EC38]|nr:hypothetical protein K449DRAFT_389290 [Hypoxylon sp. EC38]